MANNVIRLPRRRFNTSGESIVFYYSVDGGPDRQRLILLDGRSVYVRLELHNCDEVEALDRATPQAGESVLNAVAL